MAWDDRMKDFCQRRERARARGGVERLARRAAEGRLNVPGMEAVTPADSKIAGFGTIDGRPAAVCSNDFTVLAATSSRVASDKEAEVKATAIRRGVPVVYLSEAGGARMPEQRFLSYMPSHARQTPPRVAPREGGDMGTVADLVPEARHRAYDMTKVVRRLCDGEDIFEIKPRFGRTIVTARGRVEGRVVGFLANQPMHRAGAGDADGCDKAVSFLALCDSFNVPLGFSVGKEAEHKRVAGKIINWMEALALVSVPRISVIVRKTFGQAYFNMGGGGYADLLVAWPMAEMSFMDPETGVNVVHGAAARHLIDEVIDPSHTRDVITRFLTPWGARAGVGRHRLASWPTKF